MNFNFSLFAWCASQFFAKCVFSLNLSFFFSINWCNIFACKVFCLRFFFWEKIQYLNMCHSNPWFIFIFDISFWHFLDSLRNECNESFKDFAKKKQHKMNKDTLCCYCFPLWYSIITIIRFRIFGFLIITLIFLLLFICCCFFSAMLWALILLLLSCFIEKPLIISIS